MVEVDRVEQYQHGVRVHQDLFHPYLLLRPRHLFCHRIGQKRNHVTLDISLPIIITMVNHSYLHTCLLGRKHRQYLRIFRIFYEEFRDQFDTKDCRFLGKPFHRYLGEDGHSWSSKSENLYFICAFGLKTKSPRVSCSVSTACFARHGTLRHTVT